MKGRAALTRQESLVTRSTVPQEVRLPLVHKKLDISKTLKSDYGKFINARRAV